jgi:hypothetical protein
MLRTLWARLARWLVRPSGAIEPHPSIGSDRGERELEHALMESETLHVGSRADTEPKTPGTDAH